MPRSVRLLASKQRGFIAHRPRSTPRPTLVQTGENRLHQPEAHIHQQARRLNAMATLPSPRSPLFTQRVVAAMQELYPLELADRRWDNVGLLLENIDPASLESDPRPSAARTAQLPSSTVLLTNDLTMAVAEEAIRLKASVIVTYHPFIFHGFKSLTLLDPHQRITLLLAQHNMAVYSPHTAVDAAKGGLNDWLADVAVSVLRQECPATRAHVSICEPVPGSSSSHGIGYGRLIHLGKPVPLDGLVRAYAIALGVRHVMVSQPPHLSSKDSRSPFVRNVAVCAGSGYDVLKDVEADVLITGEMTHHNALRLGMSGKTVVTVFHSNSERAFLEQVMRPQLEGMLGKGGEACQVLVSQKDRDPFEVWDVGTM